MQVSAMPKGIERGNLGDTADNSRKTMKLSIFFSRQLPGLSVDFQSVGRSERPTVRLTASSGCLVLKIGQLGDTNTQQESMHGVDW